jgi:hypothetical protein
MYNGLLILILLVTACFGCISYLIIRRFDELSVQVRELWEAMGEQREHINQLDTATFLLTAGEDGDYKLIAER